MRDPLVCEDPIAERRYEYARAAAEDGDFATAAEVLEQALERAPHWAPAWFALGEAREKIGESARAAEAFAAALAADPGDSQGAGARLGLLGEAAVLAALPRTYIARLFDDYAPRFEAHLTQELDYRGPELIVQALDALDAARRFPHALDLGCGTGLAGAALRGRVDALIGVDLSPGMIAKAAKTGLYDALEVADVVEFLAAREPASVDLAVAADLMGYIGDLGGVFGETRRVLATGGWFAFSVETFEGDGFRLGAHMRFAHARAHVLDKAKAAGLKPLHLAEASLRREAGRETPALIAVMGAM